MTFEFREEVMAAFSNRCWPRVSPQEVWTGWIRGPLRSDTVWTIFTSPPQPHHCSHWPPGAFLYTTLLRCSLQLDVTAPLYQVPPPFFGQLQRVTHLFSYLQAKKSEAWDVSLAIKHSATLWDNLQFNNLFLQIPPSLPAAALLSFGDL